MPAPIPDLNRDQTCHHYQAPTGQRCGSPALKGEYYCFHHHIKQAARTSRRVLIDPEITCMEIPVIEDRASIFIALAAVVHRLAENTIDTRRAGQMIYGLQVAMRALEPPPSQRSRTNAAAPSVSEPRPVSSTTGSAPTRPCRQPAVQPATNNQQPPTFSTPTTIPITKESLLYFLRSRHCYNCNAELFPAEELTERRNPGAPPEIIEETHPCLPAPQPATDNQQPDTVLSTLQAAAENCASARLPHPPPAQKPRVPHPSRFLRRVGCKPLAPPCEPPQSTFRAALLYTLLGARYPRDLRVQSGASLLQTVPPASILNPKTNRRKKWQQLMKK